MKFKFHYDYLLNLYKDLIFTKFRIMKQLLIILHFNILDRTNNIKIFISLQDKLIYV